MKCAIRGSAPGPNTRPGRARSTISGRPARGGDSLLINYGQLGRRSRSWWGNVLEAFNAADVLVPVAELERQWPGGPVKGHFHRALRARQQFPRKLHAHRAQRAAGAGDAGPGDRAVRRDLLRRARSRGVAARSEPARRPDADQPDHRRADLGRAPGAEHRIRRRRGSRRRRSRPGDAYGYADRRPRR